MTTDSILRSYYNVTSSSFVPFINPTGAALNLLTDESQGYAIDATSYDTATAAAYVGGPVGGTVGVRDTTTPANNLSNVPLDSSNLTQAGTSAKMVNWSSSPFLRWTPHNLCLQSQTFDNATWSAFALASANVGIAPDGTSTADAYVEDTSTGIHPTTQAITSIAGVVYTQSIYAKRRTGTRNLYMAMLDNTFSNGASAFFNLSAGTTSGGGANGTGTFVSATIVDAGNGWWRCSVTGTIAPAATTLELNYYLTNAVENSSYTGDGSSSILLWGAQLVRGYNVNPYLVTTTAARVGIPQSYDVNAALFGMLIEPAATNISLRSEEFSNATWSKVTSSVTANATTGPDGGSTADKLVEDATTNLHNLSQAITVVSGTVYTHSLYAKAAERSQVGVFFFDSTFASGFSVVVDLLSGSILSAGNISAGTFVGYSVTLVGNGWYRISVSGSVPFTSGLANIYLYSNGNSNYAGNGTSGIYIYGDQVETGTFASSYVPTIAASATRARDAISALTSTLPLNTSAGTFYDDLSTPDADNFYTTLQLDDGTAANSTALYWGTGEMAMFNRQASVTNVDSAMDPGTDYMNGRARTQISYAFATNDYDSSANGGTPVTDSAGTLATGITTLRFGDFSSTGPQTIYRMVYVPRQVQTDTGDLVSWRAYYPP